MIYMFFMEITKLYSPNFNSKKRGSNNIASIIIHYTGMQSERESIERLTSSSSKVSCHYLINRSGKVFRLVEDKNMAWHAGKSMWGKYKNLNKNSIGIELVNKGHQYGYASFKKKQISTLVKLCKILKKKYKIKTKNFLGHSDVSPLRKIDPGEKFPWEFLSIKKIGIWHDFKSNFLKKYRKLKVSKQEVKKFKKLLIRIGYFFPKGKTKSFARITKAFQRHFRKELINGTLDKECLIIADNLAKKS